jgi:hypothetical protein
MGNCIDQSGDGSCRRERVVAGWRLSFTGPGTELMDEFFDRGALAGADIMSAVGDADEKCEFIVEIEKFTQAKACIEVITCTGCDLGFGGVETTDGADFAVGDGEGVLGGVDDEGMNGDFGSDLVGQLSQGLGISGRCGKAKDLSDFIGFLLIEAKDYIEVTLKANDEIQGMTDIIVITLFGICKVEEHFSTWSRQLGAEFVQDGLPDLAHIGEHGPVDETDQAGRAEFCGKAFATEALLDRRPGDLLERGMFSYHDLSVVEFEGVGLARFCNGMNFGTLSELAENRVQVGMAEDAEVSDLNAEAGEGVGHDGAVPAEFNDVRDDLKVGALPGGRGEAGGQLFDGSHAGKGFRVGAFIDDMNDHIDETVETDERGQLGDERGGFEEALGALFTEWVRIDHKLVLWRVGLRWMMGPGSVG